MLQHQQTAVDEHPDSENTTNKRAAQNTAAGNSPGAKPADWPPELGGPKGPEPTRYGDWEQKGRCTDF